MAGKTGLVVKIIDLIMVCVTLIALLALILSYISPRVNPNDASIMAYFGLAAPMIYIFNVLLMSYWAFRWSPVFFISALVLVFGLGDLRLFYHLPVRKTYEESREKDAVKIMTFNVEGFIEADENGQNRYSTTEAITDFIKSVDPDIICFQEYQVNPGNPEIRLREYLSDWPYFSNSFSTGGKNRGFGVAVYSKYPIVDEFKAIFTESKNGFMAVEVLVNKSDTLRVFCNHLQTTYIDRSNIAFFSYYNLKSDSDIKGHAKQIAKRLRKGFQQRADQADSVATVIASRNIPTVVCGDFNDTYGSYVYRTIKNGFTDTFAEKGRGYGYTYKKLYRMLRIDYILRSEELETLSYESPDVEWSDHNPVIATVRLRKTQER